MKILSTHLAALLLASASIAQSDATNLMFAVKGAHGEPEVGALVFFHPYSTFAWTGADGVAAFDTGASSSGYYPKNEAFLVSVWKPGYVIASQLLVTPKIECDSYSIASYTIALSASAAPPVDGAAAPVCGAYQWRIDSERDLPCEEGLRLSCISYLGGTATGTTSVDEEREQSVDLDAKVEASAEAKLKGFGASVNTSSSGSQSVSKKTKLKTALPGTAFPGLCGELCIRATIKRVVMRRWKWVCPQEGPAFWAPTGDTVDIDIITGACHDASKLVPCPPAGGGGSGG